MFQIAQLRAVLRATLILGADLIRDCQAIAVACTWTTELTRPADIARHSAAAALIRLADTDLVARDALTVFGIALQITHVLARRTSQRVTGVAGSAALIVRAIGRAIRVEVILARPDAEKVARAIALRACRTARVKLAWLLAVARVAEVSRAPVCVHCARAFTVALAVEVRAAGEPARALDARLPLVCWTLGIHAALSADGRGAGRAGAGCVASEGAFRRRSLAVGTEALAVGAASESQTGKARQ